MYSKVGEEEDGSHKPFSLLETKRFWNVKFFIIMALYFVLAFGDLDHFIIMLRLRFMDMGFYVLLDAVCECVHVKNYALMDLQ